MARPARPSFGAPSARVTRGVLAAGAAGLLVAVAAAWSLGRDVPRLPVSRETAIERATAAVAAHGARLDRSWRLLATADAEPGEPHAFVMDTAGIETVPAAARDVSARAAVARPCGAVRGRSRRTRRGMGRRGRRARRGRARPSHAAGKRGRRDPLGRRGAPTRVRDGAHPLRARRAAPPRGRRRPFEAARPHRLARHFRGPFAAGPAARGAPRLGSHRGRRGHRRLALRARAGGMGTGRTRAAHGSGRVQRRGHRRSSADSSSASRR